MKKWILPGLVMLVGAALIAVAVFRNLFAVGPAFESMIEDFRPWLTDDSISALRTDLDGLEGAVTEFETAMAPALAGQLGMTPEEFGAMVAAQFPAVATGMATVPEAAGSFRGIVDLLDAQQDNFVLADEIPTSDLPATTVPWGMVAAGGLAIVLGVLMALGKGRTGAVAVLVLGILLLAAPFVLSLPDKAQGADDLNAALKPVYNAELVGGASGALEVIGAMGNEMSETMLPGLGAMLGMDETEVQAFLGQNFPAIAAAMTSLPDAMGRFTGMVGAFADNLDNYDTLKPVAFVPIVWTLVAAGGALVILGGLGLMRRKTA
ncbi:MAG: hypothetical protein HZA58_04365 [Acidimicrobiia bacterium]|nr:hypothetical protein [Acidimicrobiia bacterium]